MQDGCCEEKDRHIPTVVMDNFIRRRRFQDPKAVRAEEWDRRLRSFSVKEKHEGLTNR